eukprot:2119958-Rhodomonas_salina.1
MMRYAATVSFPKLESLPLDCACPTGCCVRVVAVSQVVSPSWRSRPTFLKPPASLQSNALRRGWGFQFCSMSSDIGTDDE